VLHRSWDDFAELLIPFASEHGCALSDASTVLVEVGERVLVGQTIALVGSTGHSSGPHVHWGRKRRARSPNAHVD